MTNTRARQKYYLFPDDTEFRLGLEQDGFSSIFDSGVTNTLSIFPSQLLRDQKNHL